MFNVHMAPLALLILGFGFRLYTQAVDTPLIFKSLFNLLHGYTCAIAMWMDAYSLCLNTDRTGTSVWKVMDLEH